MSGPGGSDREYEVNENPPPWWREKVDAIPWVPEELDGTVLWFTKTGTCPRCADPDGIRESLEAEAFLGLGPREDTDVFVACRCTGSHTRPEGVVEGCGWGGYVSGPSPEGRQ